MRSLPIAVAVILLTSASAAGAEPVVAKLQTPTARKMSVIAGGAVFICQATECLSAGPTNRTITLEACRQLSKRVGPIESLGDSRRSLGPEKIAACKGTAKTS